MHFLTVKDKNLIINDSVYEFTDQVRLMHEFNEICIVSKNDSRSVEIHAPKGHVIKMYLRINDDWLFCDKVIYNYETIRIDQDTINKLMGERKEIMKEILGYGTSI